MKGPTPVAEKPPVLLREDLKYALEKLSSIISSNDYKDLSNHATEAIGEMGLFCIAQVTCPSSSVFLSFSLSWSNSVLLLGNVDDERANEPLSEPWDGSGSSQGEGNIDGGRVEGLEDGLGEEAGFIEGSKG